VKTHQPPLILALGSDGYFYGFTVTNEYNLFESTEPLLLDVIPIEYFPDMKFAKHKEEE